MAKVWKETGQVEEGGLREYRLPFKGEYVLMCGKCQRKVKKGGGIRLKKALKRVAKDDPAGVPVRVVQVPCLKLCPKGGITVCTPGQWGRSECSIVRTDDEVVALYGICRAEAGRGL